MWQPCASPAKLEPVLPRLSPLFYDMIGFMGGISLKK
jgi:hypothetical protein